MNTLDLDLTLINSNRERAVKTVNLGRLFKDSFWGGG